MQSSLRLLSWLVLALSLLWSVGPCAAQTSAPGAASHEVTVIVNAVDKNRNPVELRSEDLALSENGKRSQINRLTKVADTGVTIAVIIDVSMSQQRTLTDEKAAATSF